MLKYCSRILVKSTLKSGQIFIKRQEIDKIAPAVQAHVTPFISKHRLNQLARQARIVFTAL